MSDTLCHQFQRQVAANGTQVAIRSADGSIALTWNEYGKRVRELAAGLASLGVSRGDTVAIMLTNRPEFHIVDAAVMHLGAISFSIYNTSAPPQIVHLLDNAKPKIFVTEQIFSETIASIPLDGLTVLSVGSPTIDGAVSLDDITKTSFAEFDFEATWRAVDPGDVLTLIYTSGTTGNPKGVELTHANLLYQLATVTDVVGDLSGGRVVSYLPDAHLINRWICQYAPMYFGFSVTDVADPKTLIATLAKVRPTFFAAVPMLWYKIKANIELAIASESGPKAALGNWALTAGLKRATAAMAGRTLNPVDAAASYIADRLVLSKLRNRLGLNELTAAVSGAAPIDVEVLKFMLALGVPVLEAWGMSETSAVTTVNPVNAPRYGSVGKAIPGTELRLAEDGEILVRGPGVMRGYHNDPDRTAEALDADGWIHTGDVGVLDDGYLTIIDRKKELIINSGGKNMSPSNIEGALKASSPLIGLVAAIGDNRPHIAALITLDPDSTAAFAAAERLDAGNLAGLTDHPALTAAINNAVKQANSRLSRVEHIRSWRVLPTYWLPGGDELTPTMKLKRAQIAAKYADEIDALYKH